MDTTLELPSVFQPPICSCCSASVRENDLYCAHCGFPLKGTEKEQYNFTYHRNYKQIELADLNKKIRSATNTLYVLACISFAIGIITYLTNKEEIQTNFSLILYMVMAVIYVGLAIWCKIKPAASIISGLVLYLGFQIILAIDNPTNLVGGMIWKILIIAYLIKGLKSAFDAQKIKKEWNLE